ncbi:hypothetical protein ES707_06530 [subsurface metagenome]
MLAPGCTYTPPPILSPAVPLPSLVRGKVLVKESLLSPVPAMPVFMKNVSRACLVIPNWPTSRSEAISVWTLTCEPPPKMMPLRLMT